MTLRALELQIAIPRMQDIGKIAEQLQERPQQEQAFLALEQQQEDERNSSRTIRTEHVEQGTIDQHQKEKQDGHKGHGKSRRAKAPNDEEHDESIHPYVGHKLDISL